jgi:hypothetical protein
MKIRTKTWGIWIVVGWLAFVVAGNFSKGNSANFELQEIYNELFKTK